MPAPEARTRALWVRQFQAVLVLAVSQLCVPGKLLNLSEPPFPPVKWDSLSISPHRVAMKRKGHSKHATQWGPLRCDCLRGDLGRDQKD